MSNYSSRRKAADNRNKYAALNEKSALQKSQDRLQAPEHLDRVLYVTTPKTWLALITLLVMVCAVVAWSIMGTIATYVRADGIILSRGGMIVDASSTADGALSRILPSVGDTVTEGDVVADIYNAQTMARYVSAVSVADEWAQIVRERVAEAEQESALAIENIAKQRIRLDELEQLARERVDRFRDRLLRDKGQLTRGVIDRITVERSEQAFDLAQRDLLDVLHRRDEMEATHLRHKNDLNARVIEAKAEHTTARHRANELASVIDTWHIRAPVTGRVTEIKVQPGATLEPGDAVLGIETGMESLDTLFYISAADGKRVETGMTALVSPTTVKREEFGSITGKVESLSEFPASVEGMVAVLKHSELARSFSRNGPPYAGRIALNVDPKTASGFAWTSPQATEVNVTSGTLAAVEIEIASRPPVALVVPWVKEALGL